jgi:LysM repeat protein
MKIPLFSKLTAKSRGRKVVRASARAMRGGEEDYYEAEPNMKLSHAFMVVLILHVVAVGGIYAFNQIKVNKNPNVLENVSNKIGQAAGTLLTGGAAKSSQVAAAVSAPPAMQAATAAPVATEVERMPGDADEPLPTVASAEVPAFRTTPVTPAPAAAPKTQTPAAPVVTQVAPAKAPNKAATSAPAKAEPATSTAATYKVAKGDNPYKIAKHLGVNAQELLKANNIMDPTKLQIGQVLKVPRKTN